MEAINKSENTASDVDISKFDDEGPNVSGNQHMTPHLKFQLPAQDEMIDDGFGTATKSVNHNTDTLATEESFNQSHHHLFKLSELKSLKTTKEMSRFKNNKKRDLDPEAKTDKHLGDFDSYEEVKKGSSTQKILHDKKMSKAQLTGSYKRSPIKVINVSQTKQQELREAVPAMTGVQNTGGDTKVKHPKDDMSGI